MGDAGILPPPTAQSVPSQLDTNSAQSEIRDIHVLVTGFGAFKFFTNNPSYLIAAALPKTLSPAPPPPEKEVVDAPSSQPARNSITSFFNRHLSSQSQNNAQQQHTPSLPLRPPNKEPYRIHIHSYPSAVLVSYAPTSALIPSLLDPTTNASAFPEYPQGLDFDYILHIGLASGRDSYTLETIGHRDDFVIPDNDDQTATSISDIWKRQGVPTRLDVGWNGQDVLRRWTAEVERREQQNLISIKNEQEVTRASRSGDTEETSSATGPGMTAWMFQHGMLLRPSVNAAAATTTETTTTNQNTGSVVGGGSVRRMPRKAVVKLSKDAGRFLCEFILMCSLIYRWKEEQQEQQQQQQQQDPSTQEPQIPQDQDQSSQPQSTSASSSTNTTTTIPQANQASASAPASESAPIPLQSTSPNPTSKLGKVAFLHVPNGTDEPDIARGVLVAESAIQSFVASWEAGWRNPSVYPELSTSRLSVGKGEGSVGAGVGDREVAGGAGGVGKDGFEEKTTGDEIL